MKAQTGRLEGKRLRHAKPYQPSKADNQKAWSAVERQLDAAGDRGALYESLIGAARKVSSSVGPGFVDYLVRNGHPVVVE